MEFDKLKKQKIYFYMHIDDEIKRIHQVIDSNRIKFYDQSFTGGIHTSELGVQFVGFNVAREVIFFVDTVAILENRIKDIKKKQYYFKRYLDTLDPADKQYLIDRYRNKMPNTTNPLDRQTYGEITEIEEAMNHMRGIEPEPTTEGMTLSNDTLDTDFNSILEMMGV